LALLNYVRQGVDFSEFLKVAELEQSNRRLAAQAKIIKERAEQKLKEEARLTRLWQIREQEAEERRAFNSDPKTVAEVWQRPRLRQEYGLSDFIEQSCFPRLMEILRRVDSGERLSEDEFIWLTTKAHVYFTKILRERYHRLEAEFYAAEFKKAQDFGRQLMQAVTIASAENRKRLIRS